MMGFSNLFFTSESKNSLKNESEEDYGVRYFAFTALGLYLTIFIFLLNSPSLDVASPRFIVNAGFILLLVLFLVFYSTFSLRGRIIFLTLVMSVPAIPELFSLGLLSFGRTVLLIAPILLAVAFEMTAVLISISLVALIFLAAAAGFSFGWLTPPKTNLAVRPFHLLLDTLTMLSFSIAFIVIMHHFRDRLIRLFKKIILRNNELKQAEKEVIFNRNQLNEKVKARITELDEAKEMLVEARERLSEQNQIIIAQKTSLDQTYQKIQENQANLVQSRKMASLGSLSLGIAHEINNPLNFIQGSLMVLEKKLNLQQNPEMVKVIPIMKDASSMINKIVKSLHQFGPKEDATPTACDLNSIIQNCLVLLKPQLHPEMRFEIQKPNVEPLAMGFSEKLHQVFLNILHNAIQAIPDDGEINVSFISKPQSKSIITSITDNGSGIPQELLDKITEPFFTTKPVGQGTGLGLFISKQIIQQHKGSISFDSVPGKGTTVNVELPTG